jgi:hypothetical protein
MLQHVEHSTSTGPLMVNAFKQREHKIKYKGAETHGLPTLLGALASVFVALQPKVKQTPAWERQ